MGGSFQHISSTLDSPTNIIILKKNYECENEIVLKPKGAKTSEIPYQLPVLLVCQSVELFLEQILPFLHTLSWHI